MILRSLHSSVHHDRSVVAGLIIFLGLFFNDFGVAQESTRPSSLTGASILSKAPPATFRHYNLKYHDFFLDASASMDIEFNDNVGISETNRQSDIIVRPILRLESEWKVTKLNTLNLAIGLGYSHHLENDALDSQTLLIDPGSVISFDVYVGENMKLNFHDRLSIVQNPVDEPSLSNSARFDRVQNSVGVTAYWDFNDLSVALGYDHYLHKNLNEDFSFMDRTEEQFFGSIGLRLSDAFLIGMQSSLSFHAYKENVNNDGGSFSIGPRIEWSLSPYTKLIGSTGIQMMAFDSGGSNKDNSDFNSWYLNISIANRLNQYWSHAAIFGREARMGLEVNYTDYMFLRYAADFRASNRMNWSFEAFLENQQESGGTKSNAEYSFRYGVGTSTSFRLTPKLTLGLRYRLTDKNSDLENRSYFQNLFTISFNYDF